MSKMDKFHEKQIKKTKATLKMLYARREAGEEYSVIKPFRKEETHKTITCIGITEDYLSCLKRKQGK